MKNLLRADFRKLFKSKSFWICAIILLVLGVATVFLIELVYGVTEWMMQSATDMSVQDMVEMQMALQILPRDAWSISSMTLSDTNIAILLTIVMMMFVTGEYSSGTFNNTISRGFSRTSIYFSKFIVSLFVAFSYTILYVGSSVITAGLLWGKWVNSQFWESGQVTGQSIVSTILIDIFIFIAITASLLMVSLVMKSNGGGIAIVLALIIFLPSVLQLLSLLGKDLQLARYWLPSTPLYTETFITEGMAWVPIVVAAAYLGLSTVLGVLSFNKKDIK